MELLDLTKQAVNNLLPRKHQLTLAALALGLLILSLITGPDPDKADANSNVLFKWPFPRSSDIPDDAPRSTVAETESSPASTDVIEDPRFFLEVSSGDNLSILFAKAGLGAQDVLDITSSSTDIEALTDLHPGDRLAFGLTDDLTLTTFEVIKSPLESFTFKRNDSGAYDYAHVQRKPTIEHVYKEAVITDSLFQAAQRSSLPDRFAYELAGIFGGVIDFMMDTREGDTFNLLYEEKYLDGEFVEVGRILAAQFTNQGETHTAVRYEDTEGKSNFYNPEGESMRKAFLLNPVDITRTRISSGFSLARQHPILNTIRAHKGTDYAAPKGTPVIATADGRVTFADRNGSFGKLIVIQHGERFVTKYAHLNNYAKGIKNGTRVKQGDVIGYVGTTGGATGPHLHYEFLMDGAHRNSRTIFDQLPQAESVAAAEMPRFQQQTRIFVSLLAGKGKPAAALAQITPSTRPQ